VWAIQELQSAASSTLHHALPLMLPILGRVRVVAVAVAVADGPIRPVNHDFNAFPDRLVSGAIDGIALRVVTGPNAAGTLLPGTTAAQPSDAARRQAGSPAIPAEADGPPPRSIASRSAAYL